jgi:hypothetical protein
MRKALFALTVLTLAATPALAAIATPHLAGSLQGWNPSANPMVETAPGSGIWTATFTGLTPGNREEFKVTDGTWDNTYPGANSWLHVGPGGDITISYDTNVYADGWSPTTERLGLSHDIGTWTAVGNWQSQVGGGDWSNDNPATAMTPIGGGVYQLTATLLPGSYDWKAVVTGSWDSISWDNRSINTANWNFVTDAVNDTVVFEVNGLAGTARVTVIPEPASLALLALGLLALRRR